MFHANMFYLPYSSAGRHTNVPYFTFSYKGEDTSAEYHIRHCHLDNSFTLNNNMLHRWYGNSYLVLYI